jgi:hypothetical protein
MKLRVVAVAAALSTLVVGPGSHGQGIGPGRSMVVVDSIRFKSRD